MHRAARKTKGGGGGWQKKKEKKKTRKTRSPNEKKEEKKRERTDDGDGSSRVNKIPSSPPFSFGLGGLLLLLSSPLFATEKYTRKVSSSPSFLFFLSSSEHRPKSLMRLEARGRGWKRISLPPLSRPTLSSPQKLLLLPHRNRLRNWRSRGEEENAQLVRFPEKKNPTGERAKRRIHALERLSSSPFLYSPFPYLSVCLTFPATFFIGRRPLLTTNMPDYHSKPHTSRQRVWLLGCANRRLMDDI